MDGEYTTTLTIKKFEVFIVQNSLFNIIFHNIINIIYNNNYI